MDARGFEVNPTSTAFPEIVNFLGSKEFGTSSLGLKVAYLETIADERSLKFQQAFKSIPASQKPPDSYVAQGACPFECCRYRDWTVSEDVRLVAKPGSSRLVGTARKGTRAQGLTGEVHLTPEPVIVLAGDDLPKDSIAFVLDYMGEGFAHVYTRGKVVETFLAYGKYCFHPSQSCWGETLFPSQERKKPVWWVKVRLASGVVGWTRKPELFGNKDACG